jgi:hypothetical protein
MSLYIITALEPIASYNASAVKIYRATNSRVRFEKSFQLSKNALAYFSAGIVVVKSEVVRLAQAFVPDDRRIGSI